MLLHLVGERVHRVGDAAELTDALGGEDRKRRRRGAIVSAAAAGTQRQRHLVGVWVAEGNRKERDGDESDERG